MLKENTNPESQQQRWNFWKKDTKYTLFYHKINHDFLKDVKTQPVLEKINNYKNKCIHLHTRDRSRPTQAVIKHNPAGKRNTECPFSNFWIVIFRLERAMRPESLKAQWSWLGWWWWWRDDTMYRPWKPQILQQTSTLVLTITGDISWIVRKFITYVCTIIESKVGSSMKHVQVDWCRELKNTLQNIAEGWKLQIYIYIFLFCLSASKFRATKHAIPAVQKDKNNKICMPNEYQLFQNSR
jgi:hypothetical protein